jgi:hypothetical protein
VPVWTGAENLAPNRIRSPDYPVASCYTDYATRPTFQNVVILLSCVTYFFLRYFLFLFISFYFVSLCSECCPHTFVCVSLQFLSIHTNAMNLFSAVYMCPNCRNREFSIPCDSLCPWLLETAPAPPCSHI